MHFLQRFNPHSALIIIMLVYLVMAVAHSLIAPLTTGNDEWAHFLYVRFIAEHERLPATVAERNEAGYKSDAPPLYHLLAAGLAAGVEPVRLLRPLDSPRRYLADNIVDSYALVHTAVEQPPYRGEVLIWRMGRLLSIVFGLALIGATYLTGRQLFPEQRRRALLAAALVAWLPAFVFHSSVLSYESLSATLTALFLLAGIKILRQPHAWRWWIALGILAGLSITTKYSAVLLPLEIIFIGWLSSRMTKDELGMMNGEWQTANSRPANSSRFTFYASRFTSIALLAAVIAASWWFGFVIWHFNTIESQGPVAGILHPLLVGDASDTTSVQVASFLLGQDVVGDARPPVARNYPQLLLSFLESFWAAPVAGQFIGSPWLPLLFTAAALASMAGLWRLWRRADRSTRMILLLLVVHAGLILPLLLVRVLFSYDPLEVAQGRHLFLPAAPAIALLLIWGWEQWPARVSGLAVAGLLLWAALGQVGWAALAYPPPLPVGPKAIFQPELARARPQAVTFVSAMHLAATSWQQRPAHSLEVTLWWEAQAILAEDYLVELALLDDAGQTVGYHLGHPVVGRYPTRAWEPGDMIKDIHRLSLRPVPAGSYQLQLRLLRRDGQPVAAEAPLLLAPVTLAATPAQSNPCALFPSQDQALRPYASLTVLAAEVPLLKVVDDPASTWTTAPLRSVGPFHSFIVEPGWPASAQLFSGASACGEVSFDIPARNFAVPDIPAPLEANFNNEIQLLGYELPARRIQPGQRLPLTLYWRGLAYMGEDYRIFANPLDEQQRRWGGYDRRPRDGYSTLRWVPGEMIIDPFGVPIAPDAPPGIYSLDLGFYRPTEAGAESLPLVQDGQRLEQRSLRLGPIKVGGPPAGLTIDQAEPRVAIQQTFGSQITLLGYDPPAANHQSAVTQLDFTLYWQAETAPEADYTVFFHLRDAANQTVAQQDNPPAGGRYPTSLWDKGEIVVDKLSLPIAGVPAGRYTPVIGLYRFGSGQRLLTPDHPANEVALEPVEIR
jgi:4-amino-4-deoxy-L-arabinose transferase-like glycosyltransferase